MKVLDLFSGIGGFSLGLEAAGMRTIAFCEILPFPRRVLAHHWPGVPIYEDVRDLTGDRLASDGLLPDLICGGFPCQDISLAGAGAGIEGERSGLWADFARIIREVRPRYAIVENTAGLLSRGMGRVIGDLAALGYDSEWHCIPASAVGAPHIRDRVWIIAYLADTAVNGRAGIKRGPEAGEAGSTRRPSAGDLPDPDSAAIRDQPRRRSRSGGQGEAIPSDDGEARPLADPDRQRQSQSGGRIGEGWGWSIDGQSLADADRPRLEIELPRQPGQLEAAVGAYTWSAEPDVGRVAHGIPSRMDRIAGLGNAVVPEITFLIGQAIMQVEAPKSAEGDKDYDATKADG